MEAFSSLVNEILLIVFPLQANCGNHRPQLRGLVEAQGLGDLARRQTGLHETGSNPAPVTLLIDLPISFEAGCGTTGKADR